MLVPRSPRPLAVAALLLLCASQVAYGVLAGPLLGVLWAADPGRVVVVGLMRALVIVVLLHSDVRPAVVLRPLVPVDGDAVDPYA